MMNENWELGALYWRLIDGDATEEDACRKVEQKFLDELCGPDKDTPFFVGTVLAHPKSWVVIGVYDPKKARSHGGAAQRSLFDT